MICDLRDFTIGVPNLLFSRIKVVSTEHKTCSLRIINIFQATEFLYFRLHCFRNSEINFICQSTKQNSGKYLDR